ncbi:MULTISPECIES: hypothetical protein [Bacillus]|uniref:hypothetical protein n=1 Tax=Bacillus TaxID=1386 RepID=UPI000BFA3843|nr:MULTISPECIES: hypothetical protein [Bacillus]MCP1324235.1 hypothetical protein [Bacillus sp. S0628]PGA25316.1 hypothetical protein COL80_15600 [Bacillus thuringiensis]PGU82170.1 hypothetical protein COD76_11835 [Bacillus cereus]
MDWVKVLAAIGTISVSLVPITTSIKNILDIIEKIEQRKEKKKKKTQQNKRPVVRHNLPKSKRPTRR